MLALIAHDQKKPALVEFVLRHRDILERLETGSCWISDNSPVVGKSLGELRLRSVSGATLVAVRRKGKLLLNPGPELRFHADDIAVLIGDQSQVNKALCVLDPNLANAPSVTDSSSLISPRDPATDQKSTHG